MTRPSDDNAVKGPRPQNAKTILKSGRDVRVLATVGMSRVAVPLVWGTVLLLPALFVGASEHGNRVVDALGRTGFYAGAAALFVYAGIGWFLGPNALIVDEDGLWCFRRVMARGRLCCIPWANIKDATLQRVSELGFEAETLGIILVLDARAPNPAVPDARALRQRVIDLVTDAPIQNLVAFFDPEWIWDPTEAHREIKWRLSGRRDRGS